MNVYMVIDEETGRTGTCLNIAEFSKTLKISKFKLIKGGSGYRAILIGGRKLRNEYKTIDMVHAWFQKHSSHRIRGWRHKEFYLTAQDINREKRDTSEAILTMIEQTDKEYGSYEDLDKEINMEDNVYIDKYYSDYVPQAPESPFTKS